MDCFLLIVFYYYCYGYDIIVDVKFLRYKKFGYEVWLWGGFIRFLFVFEILWSL